MAVMLIHSLLAASFASLSSLRNVWLRDGWKSNGWLRDKWSLNIGLNGSCLCLSELVAFGVWLLDSKLLRAQWEKLCFQQPLLQSSGSHDPSHFTCLIIINVDNSCATNNIYIYIFFLWWLDFLFIYFLIIFHEQKVQKNSIHWK